MKKNIFLSIIIPSYNSQATINQTLSSLFLSSFKQPFEVIVVDDASTDDSLKVIRKYPLRILKNKTTSGPSYTRNLGAKKSRGELLLFLDSDVVLKKDTLKKIINFYQKNISEGRECVCGGYFAKDSINKGFGPELAALHYHYRFHKSADLFKLNGALRESSFPSLCGLISKKVFLKIGMFDENFKIPAGEDHDLGFRLDAKKNPIFILLNCPVSHHFPSFFKSISNFFKRGVNFLIIDKKYPQKKICYGVDRLEATNFLLSSLFILFLAGAFVIPKLFWLSLLLLFFHLFLYRRFYVQEILFYKGLFFLMKAIPAMQVIYLSKFMAAIFGLFLIYFFKRSKPLF